VTKPVLLDHNTSQILEHYHQLHHHPKYKDVWDTSAKEVAITPHSHTSNTSSALTPSTPSYMPTSLLTTTTKSPTQKWLAKVHPQKENPNLTCITIGGNRICYPSDTGTKMGSLGHQAPPQQCHLTAACKICMLLPWHTTNCPEYSHIKLTNIPTEFIDEYNLYAFFNDGLIYFKTTRLSTIPVPDHNTSQTLKPTT
jgi:hypothetical protein